MRIVVTGASGFIGRHVVAALQGSGHEVCATSKSPAKATLCPWYGTLPYVACDLHDPTLDIGKTFGAFDGLVHLAWAGLPNYKEPFHLIQNLPAEKVFLQKVAESGVKHIVISGTCFEYGAHEGACSENLPAQPLTPYATAKNELRLYAEDLQRQHHFTLQWLRLFYVIGLGQNPAGLYPRLEAAIANQEPVFNLTSGDELRDFINVDDVARHISNLVNHPELDGIINIGSGNPISLRQFAETIRAKHGSQISFNFGGYPKPDYEPQAFWADLQKLHKIATL